MWSVSANRVPSTGFGRQTTNHVLGRLGRNQDRSICVNRDAETRGRIEFYDFATRRYGQFST